MAPLHQEEQQKHQGDNAKHGKDIMERSSPSSSITTILKLVAASAFLYSAVSTYRHGQVQRIDSVENADAGTATEHRGRSHHGRRLMSAVGDSIPTYMESLMKDLRSRKKLFDDTPPEEVKYWFEYTGPLQVGKKTGGFCGGAETIVVHRKQGFPSFTQL